MSLNSNIFRCTNISVTKVEVWEGDVIGVCTRPDKLIGGLGLTSRSRRIPIRRIPINRFILENEDDAFDLLCGRVGVIPGMVRRENLDITLDRLHVFANITGESELL